MRPSSVPAPSAASSDASAVVAARSERQSEALASEEPRDAGIPARIGERYHVQALLGRGGMAAVYRVVDGEREVALKQLQLPDNARNRAAIERLFEQEFRTLAELDHPRVIRVYDYGCTPAGAYYTMELLDGGSLTDCAPLPWREACALIHDVCSSLSLLHARRLVHRDVSPHNVRRTLEGRAKLIDFGAMAAMGPSEQVVGTPAFAAPEVAHRLTLDARTDLFSLGATLYFALTGRPPYPARSFAQLSDAFAQRPAPPSAAQAEIPGQLDALVMSLLSLEPALRPRSASEVMLQLATLVGRGDEEHADVSRAYLSTPSLVGREELLLKFKRRVARAQTRAGSGLLIEGVAGLGRTRALQACALQAQTQGAVLTRFAAHSGGAQPFAAAQRLTEQLLLELPELCLQVARAEQLEELLFEPGAAPRLRTLAASRADRATLHDALSRLWLGAARDRVLLIAVDDLEHVDEPSGAWLATLSSRLKKHRLILICSAELAARETQPMLALIAQRSARYALSPLTAEQVEQLLLSAFGDVPQVGLLSDRVYRIAQGNPRACMELARHLIDRGTIRYEGGTWLLPTQLPLSELPQTMDQAFAARAAALSAPARSLAELHALTIRGGLTLQDHAQLAALSGNGLDAARDELLEHGVLTRTGDVFSISNETWTAALTQHLDAESCRERHRNLAELEAHSARSVTASAYHMFKAELAERALDRLAPVLARDVDRIEMLAGDELPYAHVAEVFACALTHAERLGRSPRELGDLRRWLCMASVGSDDAYYFRAAPGLLATLRRDSGLQDWLELAHVEDATQRITRALERAVERYTATPEAARVYNVQEAIKLLVQYVVASIVVGTRTLDASILIPLPALLEPFAVLSPVIDAIHQNALATRESSVDGRYHQARTRWQAVYDRLGTVPRDNMHYIDEIRSAILFGLGCLEAARGLPAAAERAVLLEKDPLHVVNAAYLRRVMRLQLGDFEGAERFRRQAELLAVQLNSRQMFTSMLQVELAAYGAARDLTAVREIAQRMAELAEHSPGWRTYQHIADGYVNFLRGDLAAARDALEAALARCWPDAGDPLRSVSALPLTAAVYIEVLIALGAHQQAGEFARRTLAECARIDMQTTDELERGLALAEAKLGDPAAAALRLDAVIARQRAAGVAGLQLGANYEARARIAIWAGDDAALEEYGKLAAREYRHGRGSPLGARYERLMSEARQAGVQVLPELSEFETSMLGTTSMGARASASTLVAFAMRGKSSSEERASAALRLIAEVCGTQAAHLFLVQSDGSLNWVASQSEQPHGAGELTLAQQCLERALNDDFGSTQVVSELDALALDSSAIWTDASGSGDNTQLLTVSTNGTTRHVAVVVANAPKTAAQSQQILLAVAEYLVQSGDTAGFTP
jgi:hypothetical protein